MDDKKLVKLLKNKDEAALIFLIENYSGLLKSVITRTLSKFSYLQEETLNDAILAIWENVSAYDDKKSSFKNWCASVARYKAIDAIRREVKHNSCVELDERIPAYKDNEFDKLLVKEVFNYLSDEDRKLFEAIFLDGLSYDELSKELKVSKNALYSRVKRGREKLIKEFEEGI